MYTDKINYEIVNALDIRVWLKGESLDADEQLSVQFRRIGDKYIPILGFTNLSDGVDFEQLNEISTFVKEHKSKLESLHAF